MAKGAVKRWFTKRLIGPLVRWVLQFLLKRGWVHKHEVADLERRFTDFGKQMVDVKAGLEPKPEKDADTGGRRDRFRNRKVIFRPRKDATGAKVQTQGETPPPKKRTRLRFRSRRTGAFKRR